MVLIGVSEPRGLKYRRPPTATTATFARLISAIGCRRLQARRWSGLPIKFTTDSKRSPTAMYPCLSGCRHWPRNPSFQPAQSSQVEFESGGCLWCSDVCCVDRLFDVGHSLRDYRQTGLHRRKPLVCAINVCPARESHFLHCAALSAGGQALPKWLVDTWRVAARLLSGIKVKVKGVRP